MQRIELFGAPAVTIDGKTVELGKNLGLLILLVIGGNAQALDTHSIVKALYQSRDGTPYRQREMGPEERQWARTRKHRLLSDLRLPDGQGRSFEEIARLLPQRFTIDVVDFENGIGSLDLKTVRAAAALRRRGPLATGFDDASGIIRRERRRLDALYASALSELIESAQASDPEDAIRLLTDYLALPDLSPTETARLIERRHALTVSRIGPPLTRNPPRAAAASHAIPSPKTPMIGRRSDLDFVKARLRERAFVTITGTGGIGKSRLAVAALRELRREFTDGVWFVELADVMASDDLPQQICRTLNLENRFEGPWLDVLTHYLSERDLLLVLDECERFPDACATIAARIREQCPRVAILATSREVISAGSVECRLRTLRLPDMEADMDYETLHESDAIKLFVERARVLITDFRVTAGNGGAIAQICRDLDGLPLALELAAALVDIMPVTQIAGDLHHRFEHLRDETGERSDRHLSLQAMLDSHYDLLPHRARTLLPRLSVFRGGFDADAAAAVFADLPQATSEQSALELLERKSLLSTTRENGTVRYRLLNTVRADAAAKLGASGHEDDVRNLHRDHFLRLAEEAAPHLRGRNQLPWISRLERDHDNLRAAVEYRNDIKTARLVAALWRYWSLRGYLREARRDLERVLGSGIALTGSLHAEILNAAGNIAYTEGRYGDAQKHFDDLYALGQERNDQNAIALALFGQGIVAEHGAEFETAARKHRESLALFETLGDTLGIANARYGLAIVALNTNDYALAAQHQAEGLAVSKSAGDLQGMGKIVSVRGTIAYMQGDYEEAGKRFQEAFAHRQAINDRAGIVTSRNQLGYLAQAQGQYEAAHGHFVEAINGAQAIGDRWGELDAINNIANLDAAQDRLDEAAHGFQRACALARDMNALAALPVFNSSLGMIARRQGRYAEAWELLSASLREFEQRGETDYVAEAINELASLAWAQRDLSRAATLYAAYGALLQSIGAQQTPDSKQHYDAAIAKLQAELAAPEFAAAWDWGAAFTGEQAVEFALTAYAGSHHTRKRVPAP